MGREEGGGFMVTSVHLEGACRSKKLEKKGQFSVAECST